MNPQHTLTTADWLAAGIWKAPNIIQDYQAFPFYQNGHTYATDAKAIVRIPGRHAPFMASAPDVGILPWHWFEKIPRPGIFRTLTCREIARHSSGPCPTCGNGLPGRDTKPCRDCDGEGEVLLESRCGLEYYNTCRMCRGNGGRNGRIFDPDGHCCQECRGTRLKFDLYRGHEFFPGQYLNLVILYLLCRAYGWVRLFGGEKLKDAVDLSPFVFPGGQGFIMGMREPR